MIFSMITLCSASGIDDVTDAAFRVRLYSCWPLVMFLRAGQRQMFAEPLSYTEHYLMMQQPMMVSLQSLSHYNIFLAYSTFSYIYRILIILAEMLDSTMSFDQLAQMMSG